MGSSIVPFFIAVQAVFRILGATGAGWKPSLCRQGIEEGSFVELEVRCVPEGIEVTWTSTSRLVDSVQIEYVCRNHTQDEQQPQDKTERNILIANSIFTTGNRVISQTWSSQPVECTISGCYEEVWFDRYAITPTKCTYSLAPQAIHTIASPVSLSTIGELQTSPLTTPPPSLSSEIQSSAAPVPIPVKSTHMIPSVDLRSSHKGGSLSDLQLLSPSSTTISLTAMDAVPEPIGTASGAKALNSLESLPYSSASPTNFKTADTDVLGFGVLMVVTVAVVICTLSFMITVGIVALLTVRRQRTIENVVWSLKEKGGQELAIEHKILAGSDIDNTKAEY